MTKEESKEIAMNEKYNCETCKGKKYIKTTVYHHPTLPDGTERIEECDECKHLTTTMSDKQKPALSKIEKENLQRTTFRRMGYSCGQAERMSMPHRRYS